MDNRHFLSQKRPYDVETERPAGCLIAMLLT